MTPVRALLARLAPAVLAACSAAPLPPAPPRAADPPPAPPPLAATAAPVLLPSLVGEPPPPIPAPAAAAFAPLTLEVAPAPYRAGLPAVYGVSGRSDRDVYVLAHYPDNRVTLLHWDGARTTDVPGPKCSGEFWGVTLTDDDILLTGTIYGEGYTGTVTARRRGREWTCESSSRDQHVPTREGVLRVHDSEVLHGDERQPSPGDYYGESFEMAAGTAANLWIYVIGGDLVLHGNGIAWEPRPPGVARVHSLRVDLSGTAWLVGGDGKSDEGGVVERWDREAHAWRRLPAPEGLRGSRVRARAADDVWILGKEHLYHWDGHVFRRGRSPLAEIHAAWLSPTSLWLAGARPGGEGAVLRLVEKKP
jgi:hypothetical protein